MARPGAERQRNHHDDWTVPVTPRTPRPRDSPSLLLSRPPLCSLLGDPRGSSSGLPLSSSTVWVSSSCHQSVFASDPLSGALAVGAINVFHVDMHLFTYLSSEPDLLCESNTLSMIIDLSSHNKVGGILREFWGGPRRFQGCVNSRCSWRWYVGVFAPPCRGAKGGLR